MLAPEEMFLGRITLIGILNTRDQHFLNQVSSVSRFQHPDADIKPALVPCSTRCRHSRGCHPRALNNNIRRSDFDSLRVKYGLFGIDHAQHSPNNCVSAYPQSSFLTNVHQACPTPQVHGSLSSSMTTCPSLLNVTLRWPFAVTICHSYFSLNVSYFNGVS